MIQTLQTMCALGQRWKPDYSNVTRMAAYLVEKDRGNQPEQRLRQIFARRYKQNLNLILWDPMTALFMRRNQPDNPFLKRIDEINSRHSD